MLMYYILVKHSSNTIKEEVCCYFWQVKTWRNFHHIQNWIFATEWLAYFPQSGVFVFNVCGEDSLRTNLAFLVPGNNSINPIMVDPI